MSRYTDDRYNNKQERETGKPHPDCEVNYQHWRNLIAPDFESSGSRGFIKLCIEIKCKIVEFFIWNGQEVNFTVLEKPHLNNRGIEEILPPNLMEPFNKYPNSVPLCVQISFVNKKNKNISSNINFQQDFNTFKRDVKYFLKLDL